MFKRPNKKLIARAELAADRLRRGLEVIERVSWELDEALSALNKDAAGYRRANKANPDGGASYVEGELEKALATAESLNRCLLQAATIGEAVHNFRHERSPRVISAIIAAFASCQDDLAHA